MSYAGFWKRFAAAFIDLLITSVLGGIAGGFLYSGSTATFGAGWVNCEDFGCTGSTASLDASKVCNLIFEPIGSYHVAEAIM